MSDNPLSNMTDDEIIAELRALRERRARAAQARISAKQPHPKESRSRQGAVDVSGMSALDDLFSEDAGDDADAN